MQGFGEGGGGPDPLDSSTSFPLPPSDGQKLALAVAPDKRKAPLSAGKSWARPRVSVIPPASEKLKITVKVPDQWSKEAIFAAKAL